MNPIIKQEMDESGIVLIALTPNYFDDPETLEQFNFCGESPRSFRSGMKAALHPKII